MFFMDLHQFGASAFAKSRTFFWSITLTFGTLLEHLQHTLKGVSERRSPRPSADADVPFASLQSALPPLGVTKFRLKQLQAINLSLVVPHVPRNLIQFQPDKVLATHRFSAARAHRGRKLTLMNLRASSNRSNIVSNALDRESSFGINDRIAHPGHCRHLKV